MLRQILCLAFEQGGEPWDAPCGHAQARRVLLLVQVFGSQIHPLTPAHRQHSNSHRRAAK